MASPICLDHVLVDLHTDCVAWNSNLDLIVLTCYHLVDGAKSTLDNQTNLEDTNIEEEDKSQQRLGKIYFYRPADKWQENSVSDGFAIASQELVPDKPNSETKNNLIKLLPLNVITNGDQISNSWSAPSGIFDVRWSEECLTPGSMTANQTPSQFRSNILNLGLADGTVTRLSIKLKIEAGQETRVVVEKLEQVGNDIPGDMSLGVDVAKLPAYGSWINVDEDESIDMDQEPTKLSEFVASGFQSGAICVWDTEHLSKGPIWSHSEAHMAEVWQVQFICDYSKDIMDGNISYMNDPDGTLLKRWKATEEAIWGSNLSSQTSHAKDLIVSGSDDASFKIWDTRRSSSKGPVAQNTKHYQMGVTCFASPMGSPCQYARNQFNNALFVGSYDETLSMWDLRRLGKAPLNDIKLGGGVWRLRWLPNQTSEHSTLSVAAMHAGFKVIRVKKDEETFEEVCQYWGPHTGSEDGKFPPLAYGIDWVTPKISSDRNTDSQNSLLAGCTFYDNRISLWKSF